MVFLRDIAQKGANLVQKTVNTDLEKVKQLFGNKVKPVLDGLIEFWGQQTIRELLIGKVKVPDSTINKYLKAKTAGDEALPEMCIRFMGDNKLQIEAFTTKTGKVNLVAELGELKHNEQGSSLSLTVLQRNLPERPLLSKILGCFALSTLLKLFGPVDIGPGISISPTGNMLTVDFTDRLRQSPAGKLALGEQSLLNVIAVNGGKVYKGYIELDVSLAQSLREKLE